MLWLEWEVGGQHSVIHFHCVIQLLTSTVWVQDFDHTQVLILSSKHLSMLSHLEGLSKSFFIQGGLDWAMPTRCPGPFPYSVVLHRPQQDTTSFLNLRFHTELPCSPRWRGQVEEP